MATDSDKSGASARGGVGISIRRLYKIFGPRAEAHLEAVLAGMTKQELLSKHNHVLGLRNINIDMPAGGIQVIMGLSGSGKSTLIRHINRLIEPTSGEVLVGGDDVVKMNPRQLVDFRRHKTGMVFQKFALLPHWTVIDNAAYGLAIQGVPEAERNKRAMRWIERVGLKGFEAKYPNQLSGGMQQRVGLARALTIDAPVLLMDEAFSALDPLIRVDMQTVLLDIQKEIRKTIVFITHDLDEALRLGDRIAILRDGEVVQQGTAQEIVLTPADEYVSSFVREVNRGRVILVDTIARRDGGGPRPTGLTVPAGTTLEAAARAMTDAAVSDAVVVDAAGRPVGHLDMRAVVAAMVTPGGVAERQAAE